MSKHKQSNFCTPHVVNLYFFRIVSTRNSMNNLLSYCGLTDARISASEKDLPVTQKDSSFVRFFFNLVINSKCAMTLLPTYSKHAQARSDNE